MLNYPGSTTMAGVPSPALQGLILPSGNGPADRVSLGMGRMTRRFADLYGGEGGQGISPAQLQSLITAAAQAGAVQTINYNFEGMVGPPGPPGVSTKQYVRLPSVLGQTGRYGEDGADGADGEDAFADIDLPVPYDGWEGAFTDNSPIAGSVAWTSFKVKYKGDAYTITAANTALEYLYWDVTVPTVLSSTATRTDAVGIGKFLVGRNNAGAFEQSQFIKLITAGFISVNQLSALAADLGTCTAGSFTSNLGTTYRLRMSPSGLQGSIDSGANWFNIIGLDGTDVLIQGTKIKALSIETGKLEIDSVTAFTDATTAADSGWKTETWAVIQTVASFVATGGRILLQGACEARTDWGSPNVVNLRIRRGATTVKEWTVSADDYVRSSDFAYDAPAAGTYTFTLEIASSAAAYDVSAKNNYLSVEETKR